MAAARKFGMFSGVFTPSVLTILGVIMYLRLPWIIGNGGLLTTFAIILVAHVISITTGLSVSSIATDKKVKAGGTYYMISRSLGLPIGGTLGLALFVGLSLSVSLYVIGFTESFLAYWGWALTLDSIRIAGTIALFTITTVTFISTALALKTQFFILAAIVLSLLSIVFGFGVHDLGPAADATPISAAPRMSFIVLFGIFFPAVTGFEAGVSMSGDLENPKRSIPRGTIAAIVVGLCVYLALSYFLAVTVNAQALRDNPRILIDIAYYGPLVVAGIWGATISSAFGSILAAPRILQATAVDRIVPRVFARGHGAENEPRRAMLLTFAIAQAGILIGDLDVIARIVSMFFITAYGFLNLSAAIESWASPDFRPEFRVWRAIPIIGALACFVVMIQLDFVAMIASTLLLGAIYLYLARKELTLESGDTWEGVWSSVARTALLRLTRGVQHRRNWRPNILQFGSPEREPHLLALAHTLAAKRGVVTNMDIVDSGSLLPRRCANPPPPEAWTDRSNGVFFKSVEFSDRYEGIANVAALYGFSGIDPNTLIFAWPDDAADDPAYRGLLRRLSHFDYNLLLASVPAREGFGRQASVDVWWGGRDRNIGLAIALVKFLSFSDEWPLQRVRFFVVHDEDAALDETLARSLELMLDRQRVEAAVRVFSSGERRSLSERVAEESADTDLAIICWGDHPDHAHAFDMPGQVIAQRGATVLVRASSMFDEVALLPKYRSVPEADASKHDAPSTHADEIELEEGLAREHQSAMDDLALQLRALCDEFADGFVEPTFVELATLLEELTTTIDATYSNLAEHPKPDDRNKVLRAIARAHSGVLFKAGQSLQRFFDERLEVQGQRLAELSAWLRDRSRQLIDTTPERVRVPRTENPEQPEPALTWWNSRSIRFRRRTTIEMRTRFVPKTLESIQDMQPGVRALIDALRTLLRAASDGLTAIERDLRDAEAQGLTELVSPRHATVQAQAQALRAELDSVRQQLARTLAQARRLTLSALGRPLARRTEAPPPLAAPPTAKKIKAQRAAVAELCGSWQKNRSLDFNRVLAFVWLASFHARIRTIVTRCEHDLRLTMDNNFISPLRAMATTMQTMRDDPEAAAEAPKLVYTGQRHFSGSELIEEMFDEIERAIEDLPEEVSLPPEDPEADDGRTLKLRATVQYQLDADFAALVRDELVQSTPVFHSAANVARDVVSLTRFDLAPSDDGGSDASSDGLQRTSDEAKAAIDDALTRLEETTTKLEEQRETLVTTYRRHFEATTDQLNLTGVIRTMELVARRPASRRGARVISRLADLRTQMATGVEQQLVKLQYGGSEGLFFARRLGGQQRRTSNSADRLRDLIESVVAPQPILDQLPSYYRQLFLGKPTLSHSGVAPRRREIKDAELLMARRAAGACGALAVLGDPRSGKQTLAHLIARRVAERGRVYWLRPHPGGSTHPDVLRRRLVECLGGKAKGGTSAAFHQLGDGVLVVDEIERWWNRSHEGGGAIELLKEIIGQYGDSCKILVTANSRSFRLLDQLHGLQDFLLGTVGCAPVSAQTLKHTLLARHESTGLELRIEGIEDPDMSEWAVAKLFTGFFRYSQGNIGDALHAWVAHISRVDGNVLTLRRPITPDIEALAGLRPLQTALLIQWILHRRLTLAKLAVVSGMTHRALDEEVSILRRARIIVERGGGGLELNPFLEPHIIRQFESSHHI